MFTKTSIVFFITCLALCSAAFDASHYTGNKEIIPGSYFLYWRIDTTESMAYIAVKAHTLGWVGFGIAEHSSGSMPGADIFTGSVVGGVGSITDRHSSDFVMPDEDCKQDWTLVSAEETDGWTILEVKRPLDTNDKQDRPIVEGPVRIIAAFGGDTQETISYHNANRITSEVTFFGASATWDTSLPADVQTIDVTFGNFTTAPDPKQFATLYACHAFAMPSDQEYHIVRVDPIIDPRNVKYVHHAIVHTCSDVSGGFVGQYLTTPGRCSSPLANPKSGCDGLIATWGAGGGPNLLPAAAGYPMGPSVTSTKFVIIEMHYNDLSNQFGFQDDSGFRFYYTKTLRQYDAGGFIFGDLIPGIGLKPLPARAITHYETECPSSCTQQLPHNITIFYSFPHMHTTGSKFWSSHWRNGVQIGELGRVEFYDFDIQQTEIVNTVVMPGDRFNTHCIYNTAERENITMFGEASYEEMCMHFLAYYPRIITARNRTFSACGEVAGKTSCGDSWINVVANTVNPNNTDPAGGDAQIFGVASVCGAENATTIYDPAKLAATTTTSSATRVAVVALAIVAALLAL